MPKRTSRTPAGPFEQKMERLTAELQECFAEGDRLKDRIKANLEGLGYGKEPAS